MTNPTETPLRERMAVMLGFRKTKMDGLWQYPGGRFTTDLPPWDTDDSTALRALNEFCGKKGLSYIIRSDAVRGGTKQVCIYAGDHTQCESSKLARAICDAMLAVAKTMEETNMNIDKCVACARGSACPHCGKSFCVAHGSEHLGDCKVEHAGREK